MTISKTVTPLRSGTKTGALCQCGAPVWAYHRTRWYQPGETIPDSADDPTWFWHVICEHGHEQVEVVAPVQLSLLEAA